jgi:(R,R)-butanediol dehydrogenase/meso-butanediol dehydrogenase/diacetyl reductase
MRAAVIDGPGRLAVRDVEVAVPGPGEVLVRISYCGVCGTDLHSTLDGWAAPGTVGGHEWSGVIAATGPDVDLVAEGDLVVGGPSWCGRCEWCVAGRPSLCVADPIRNTDTSGHGGAFAEFHLASATSVHRAPAGLDPRVAALSEPLAVALHGITVAALPGDPAGLRVLVSGSGPLGLLVIAALRDRGVTCIVAEPAAARRETALAAGAAAAVDPADLPAVPPLPTQTSPEGFDVVFETSGTGAAIGTALALLRPTGRLVLLGTGAMSVKLDPIRILLNELVVTGAYCYDDTGIEDALALLASGRLPLDALLAAEDVGLDDLLDAMNRLKIGDIPRKVLVRP